MNKREPLVSIIVPIYGVEKHIAKCAHSLFTQTYSNVEYLFVNDCTKDGSMKVLDEVMTLYPERQQNCRIIEHDVNKGLAAARYTGISYVTGEYVMHVDSDDYLEHDAVSIMVDKVIEDDSDIVIGGSYSVFPTERVQNVPYPHYDKDTLLMMLLHMRVSPSVWGKLYSSKLYALENDTLPLPGVNHGEDFATVPRLVHYAQKISYVDVPLYNYVQFNDESYSKNYNARSMRDMAMAAEKLSSFFKGIIADEMIDLCKLRVKLSMYKYMNIALYDEIRALFPEESGKSVNLLSIPDRILNVLVELRMYRLAVLFVKLGFKIRRIR